MRQIREADLDRIKYVPVYDKDAIAIYDIYIDGRWHGSRRTMEQCLDQVYYTIYQDEVKAACELRKHYDTIAKQEAKDQRLEAEREQAKGEDYSEVEALLDRLFAAEPAKVEAARQKPKAIDWFVGQVMKEYKGKYKPMIVKEIVERRL